MLMTVTNTKVVRKKTVHRAQSIEYSVNQNHPLLRFYLPKKWSVFDCKHLNSMNFVWNLQHFSSTNIAQTNQKKAEKNRKKNVVKTLIKRERETEGVVESVAVLQKD